MTTASHHLTYHVAPHDDGWAYRLEDVWSEPFPTFEEAQAAAQEAAERQHQGGRSAEIVYQTADGSWRRESVKPSDQPDVSVTDD